MARSKRRRRADAATPAEAHAKRPRANRARAAAPANIVHDGKPLRRAHAANSRTPVAHIASAADGNATPRPQPSPMPPIDWSATFAPLTQAPEPSLWQELSQPILRRIARRQRELAGRVTRQLARMRIAVRRTQRHGARAWERGIELWHAVQRDLRRRRRALAFSARRKLRRFKAGAFSFIAAVRRQTQAGMRRGWRAAQASFRRAWDGMLAGCARAIEHVMTRINERVVQPALWPFRPAQREALAIALAALAVTIVAVAWLAIYSALSPPRATITNMPPAAPAARTAPAAQAAPEARQAAAAKEFTERAVTPTPPPVVLPAATAPAAPPPEAAHDAAPPPTVVVLPPAAAPLPAKPARQAAPGPAKRKPARARARRKTAPLRTPRRASRHDL